MQGDKLNFCKIIICLISVCAACAHVSPDQSPPGKTLQPQQTWEIYSPVINGALFDPSGLLRYQDQWLVVSDKPEYQDIYILTSGLSGKTLQAKPFLSLDKESQLPGFDFEGMAYCFGEFLLIEERSSRVLRVSSNGSTQVLKPDFSALTKGRPGLLPHGIPNAGLEGIACDEKGKRIFLAQERDFRMIYEFSWPDLKPISYFDVASGWDIPYVSNKGLILPDFADLYFEAGYLYALQRSDHKVMKIDLQRRQVVAWVELDFKESDYYDYDLPYGMAEGLFLTQDSIHILLDNNGKKLKHAPHYNHAMMMKFKRPGSF